MSERAILLWFIYAVGVVSGIVISGVTLLLLILKDRHDGNSDSGSPIL